MLTILAVLTGIVLNQCGEIMFHIGCRFSVIPLKRLEDDFPSYAKQAKNGDVHTHYVHIESMEVESASR